ncbi:efflux RND transporter periplasmic adaptor subunit [Maribellus maritimus]|uniref:efflux RND transporter periplasmic adaptor subunit n=1 Tax=Maribellus maritimus TaxID=2870838 RepID=UPI001EEA55A9|nr:efflux RND transporter periplasmic adaptor subunit [Maribellus maritimus]MCG6189011.1 efflux RND transporter periplasmic adaptor subunit [Maribellus maritimus]
MSWRKITFIVVALILLLGGSAALSMLFISLKPEPQMRPEQDLKRFVKAKTVVYSDIVSPLSSEGRVVSSSEVMLVAEASGKIEEGGVSLRKGTSFRKGQLIATIYKDEVELALKARKSNFLTSITTLLPDIKIDYPDQYELFQKFFNAIDMNKNLPELPEVEQEQLKIFLASRGVLSEYYGIKQDEKRLSRHSLYAPFSGTFTEVNFEVGAYVNTGGQIAKMIRTDQLEVEVPVVNEQSKWIKIGDKVEVYSRNHTDMKPGTVVRKSDFVNENQFRSIFVRVNSLNNDELLTGEYKQVLFPGQKIHSAMEIPRNAIFNSNEVFIVEGGELKKRQINILKTNETTLIFNGLKESEEVVVEPLINVKENSPVGILDEDNQTGEGQNNQNNKPDKQA